MNDEQNLPMGWVQAKLGDFCTIIMGQSPPSSNYNTKGEGLPFFQGKAEFTDLFPVTRKWCTGPTKIAEANDILLSIRAPVGPTNLAPLRSSIGRGLAAIRPEGNIETLYVLYAIRAFNSRLIQLATGTTFEAVSGDEVRAFKIPLAPLSEQQRIISIIEQQFTRIDAGIADLKRMKKNLQRSRVALLRDAIEGKLTEKWRKAHPDAEPASVLLQHILDERRAKWEADIRAKGKDPKKERYVEPAVPRTKELPDLPERWCWATVEQLSTKIVDGTHHTPTYTKSGVPFISVKDIQSGHIYFNNCKYISQEEHDRLIQRCHPEKDDVLITKSGTIGRVAIVNTHETFSLFVSVALIKTCKCFLNQEYFKLALEYYISSINIQQAVKGGLIKNLHLEDLRIVSLRLPPFAEQEQIVAEVEQQLTIINKYEAVADELIRYAEWQRQAILQRAFSGQLVKQDPNDEPASVLLERIQQERKKRAKKQVVHYLYASEDGEPLKVDPDEVVQTELWPSVEKRFVAEG